MQKGLLSKGVGRENNSLAAIDGILSHLKLMPLFFKF